MLSIMPNYKVCSPLPSTNAAPAAAFAKSHTGATMAENPSPDNLSLVNPRPSLYVIGCSFFTISPPLA
jgi:hypothetical protein